MENKYDIKFNPPQLSSDQIARHKDFAALLQQVEEEKPPVKIRPLRRRIYRMSGIAAAVLLLVYLGIRGLGWNTFNPDTYASPFFNPPLQEMALNELDLQTYSGEAKTITLASGTKIIIPDAAFVDQSGNLVTGRIDIDFQEYLDPIDFFAKGVTMEYDSANGTYQMASAGMISIKAYNHGEEVFLQDGKSISIAFDNTINYSPSHQYFVYQANQEEREWKKSGKDNITPQLTKTQQQSIDEYLAKHLPAEIVETEQALAVLEDKKQLLLEQAAANQPLPQQPEKPQQRRSQQSFAAQFDFSEANVEDQYIQSLMAQYQNMFWEISADQEDKYKVLQQVSFDNVTVRKQGTTNLYEINLSNDAGRTLQILASPVLAGDDLAKAQSAYEQELQAYETAVQERTVLLQAKEEEIDTQIAKEKSALLTKQASYQQELNALKQKGWLVLNERNTVVNNQFNINSLGTWNCGRILPKPNKTINNFTIVDSNNKPLTFKDIYLVNLSQNGIKRLYKNQDIPLQANDIQQIWIVTEDGKLGVSSSIDVENLEEKPTFKITMSDQSLTTEDELRAIIKQ